MLARNVRLILVPAALLCLGATIAYAAMPETVYVYDGAGNMTRASSTTSDPLNCGSAGNACSASTTCCQGACVSCTDGAQNCTESDVDCGGWCGKCAVGKHCNAATDCASSYCLPTTHVCSVPSCSDAVQNQDETGIDCGGSTCGPCLLPSGALCGDDVECTSGVCHKVGGNFVCL